METFLEGSFENVRRLPARFLGPARVTVRRAAQVPLLEGMSLNDPAPLSRERA